MASMVDTTTRPAWQLRSPRRPADIPGEETWETGARVPDDVRTKWASPIRPAHDGAASSRLKRLSPRLQLSFRATGDETRSPRALRLAPLAAPETDEAAAQAAGAAVAGMTSGSLTDRSERAPTIAERMKGGPNPTYTYHIWPANSYAAEAGRSGSFNKAIPGYTGHVPGSQYIAARTYGDTVRFIKALNSRQLFEGDSIPDGPQRSPRMAKLNTNILPAIKV